MPRNSFSICLSLLAILIVFSGCSLTVSDFTKEQLKWFKPYSKVDTVVFISNKSELDTIIFDKVQLSRDTVRNVLELGYYSTTYLSIPYRFTKGSYHQFALMGDGNRRYDQALFSLSKTSNNQSQFEIIFIGTIFNGKELMHIKKLTPETFYFSSKQATYSGINVEKGIKDFTFDSRIGIVKFTDERNIYWERLKK
jgi:hypothetical protein